MAAEDALLELGMIGRWQVMTYCIICILGMFPSVWQTSCIIFVGYTYHRYHCDKKPGLTLNESVPHSVEDGELVYSKCQQYKYNMSYSNETERCTQFYYEPDYFDPSGTITQEWDLVCERDGFVEYSQMLLNVGTCFGLVFFAPFADIFGRKVVFFFCQLIMIIFGIAMAFSTDYITWCFMQFLTGAFYKGNDLTGFVLANELFPADIRIYTASLINVFWVFGGFCLILMAYFIRHWRMLQFVLSVLPLSTLAFYFWCPESIRWLFVQREFEKGQAILDRCADFNGMERVPPEILKKPSKEAKSYDIKPKFTTYMRHRKLCIGFIFMTFCMFTTMLMMGGTGLLIQALSGDLFTNVTIAFSLEFPGVVSAIIVMIWFGRRKSLSAYLLFGSFLLLMATVFDAVEIKGLSKSSQDQIVTAFALLSRFAQSGAFSILLVYIQEILPTSIRTTGTGLFGGFGFLGIVLGPLALQLARNTSLYYPMGIMAGLALISGILVLYQPETLGRVLPTTIEEVLEWPRDLTKEEWEDIAVRRTQVFEDIKRDWMGKKPKRLEEAKDAVLKEPNSYTSPVGYQNLAFTPDVTKF